MSQSNVFRDGKIHVCRERCKTCIFRRGNLMRLEPGRVKGMIDDTRRTGGVIICHSTLGTDENSVCRGFFEKHPPAMVQIADRLGLVVLTEEPHGDE